MAKKKVIRVVTVDLSFGLLVGQLNFLNKYYNVIGISSSGPNIEEAKEREGVHIIPLEMERSISVFKDLKSLYNLYKVFKKEKPDLVHSITPKAGLLSMTAAFFARVPNRLHTFTGLIFPSKEGILQKILINTDRILCYFATRIYPEGNGVKKDLEKFKITSKPLKIIANGNVNGIDISFFDPELFTEDLKKKLRRELQIDTKDFVFVFVGRLVSDKGINELVEAFKGVTVRHKTAKLLLVGDYERNLDPIDPKTEEEINNNPNIIGVGWQNDVRPYLSISDALAFPSYREGFPNVVMQAGAMNLPCIVTNISGCNEIISDGVNGLIITPKDAVELEKAMDKLLLNPVDLALFASNARTNICNKYERSFVWDKLLEEYRSLI